MSRSFSLTAHTHTLRNLVAALVVLVPASVLAVDNGNLGTPQNDCEQRATNDYYTNLASCDKNLAGDAQSIAQCKQDFSYDYNDAIAACKSAAMTSGGKLHGKFGNVLDGQSVQTLSTQSLKHGALKFGHN